MWGASGQGWETLPRAGHSRPGAVNSNSREIRFYVHIFDEFTNSGVQEVPAHYSACQPGLATVGTYSTWGPLGGAFTM